MCKMKMMKKKKKNSRVFKLVLFIENYVSRGRENGSGEYKDEIKLNKVLSPTSLYFVFVFF